MIARHLRARSFPAQQRFSTQFFLFQIVPDYSLNVLQDFELASDCCRLFCPAKISSPLILFELSCGLAVLFKTIPNPLMYTCEL